MKKKSSFYNNLAAEVSDSSSDSLGNYQKNKVPRLAGEESSP